MTYLLIFLIVNTQLNISFAIKVTVCFTKNPSYLHIKAIKIIFSHMKRLIHCNTMYDVKEKLII